MIKKGVAVKGRVGCGLYLLFSQRFERFGEILTDLYILEKIMIQ